MVKLMQGEVHEEDRHVKLLDRLYGIQRHYYDLTRKYFLLGRDELLVQIVHERPTRILEVGCGTARNLIALARQTSVPSLVGVDASREMLKTARERVSVAGLDSRISLSWSLAERLSASEIGLTEAPDSVFFSYSLSMIPRWQEALERAFDLLAPGGSLWVVDFWDQHTFAQWWRALLRSWLALFEVRYQPAHREALSGLGEEDMSQVRFQSIGGSYAYLCQVRKARAVQLGHIDRMVNSRRGEKDLSYLS